MRPCDQATHDADALSRLSAKGPIWPALCSRMSLIGLGAVPPDWPRRTSVTARPSRARPAPNLHHRGSNPTGTVTR